MSFKSIIWFSKKSSKISNKKIIFPIVLCSIIIVSIFSFNKSIHHYLYEGIMKNYNYNYYFITYVNSGDTQSQVFDKLTKIDHINDVFLDNYQLYSVYLDSIANNDIKGNFYLIGITNEMISKKLGFEIELEDNEIICPEIFYPSDNIEGNKLIHSSTLINMENMKNQKILAHYYKYIDDYNFEQKNIELNIIETYKNNDNLIDENLCYSTRNLVKTIFDDAYSNIDLSNQISSIIISIDDQNNYKEIKNAVEKYGYEISGAFSLNSTFLSFINSLSYIIVAFSIIFVIILTSNLNKKNLLDKTKELSIIKSIGGNNKNILYILLTEAFIAIITCFIYSIISIVIISSLLKILVSIYPFIFDSIPILIDYDSLFLFTIIFSIILIFENILYSKKICNNMIGESIYE